MVSDTRPDDERDNGDAIAWSQAMRRLRRIEQALMAGPPDFGGAFREADELAGELHAFIDARLAEAARQAREALQDEPVDEPAFTDDYGGDDNAGADAYERDLERRYEQGP